MTDSLLILGRQPALGLAELESLYGPAVIKPLGTTSARIALEPCAIDFHRLGGSLKLCKVLAELPTTNWKQIEKFLRDVSPGHTEHMPDGKMHLGLSAYGLEIGPQQLLATGLTLKKIIQGKTGRSVRLVPNKQSALNAAQIIHNNLTGPNGWELVFVGHNDQTVIAQTIYVQDIDSYSERDFGRPKRDARVGMLPPKLAQIIINTASGRENVSVHTERTSTCEPGPMFDKIDRRHTTVLDPFCGTGVILQEALLMGFNIQGTDIDPRMVDYTRANLDWLAKKAEIANNPVVIAVADAATYTWLGQVSVVASETYLGRPFTTLPSPEVLSQTVSDCNLIIKKTLRNLHRQLSSGTRLCLAVPAWQTSTGLFKHLPLVDQIDELGYNQVRFEHVRNEDLLYYRAEQFVARELLVITRK